MRDTVREQLQELLRQYPPAVGEVLRRDHSLLTRADYLAPYPQLVAFIQQHPEIIRNPTFYFGELRLLRAAASRCRPSSKRSACCWAAWPASWLSAPSSASLAWLVRAVIQHRRWLRQSKVQAEVHTKLMDRMTTNEELLAYIQSPAGRRFLESAPMQPEVGSPRLGAPVGPIIWSMMAGIVLGDRRRRLPVRRQLGDQRSAASLYSSRRDPARARRRLRRSPRPWPTWCRRGWACSRPAPPPRT